MSAYEVMLTFVWPRSKSYSLTWQTVGTGLPLLFRCCWQIWLGLFYITSFFSFSEKFTRRNWSIRISSGINSEGVIGPESSALCKVRK